MQGNRGKNTKPELHLRRLLREAGYPGYRLHWKNAPGHPDIAYPGRKVAIFVNGCFWHRCPLCKPPMPKSNNEFWEAKFAANQDRDLRQTEKLESTGWTVLVLWECQLKAHPGEEVARVVHALHG
jgi:DNA mismatch endonuclease (patch repair protein)